MLVENVFVVLTLATSYKRSSIIIDGHSNYRGKLSLRPATRSRSVATHGRKSGHLVTPYAGKFADTRLRDVPTPVFEQYKHLLPENFRKRAEHYFSEYRRAEEGAEAWRKGDLETYGELIFESGRSSIENYECGCPELITLYNIMTEAEGIYGGRFSGAGFKGCCMALVDPEKAEDVLRIVEEKYLAVYPALKGKYLGALCDSADGVKL